MWGLVGNPEDRFSQNEAQLKVTFNVRASVMIRQFLAAVVFMKTTELVLALNEPRSEKTGLRGFRPGPT